MIGLFNLGLHWEARTAFVENITWELQSQLTLSRSQTLKIMEINYDFYDEISKVSNGDDFENKIIDDQISRLISDKNRKIMNVLNEDQQLKWVRSYLLRNTGKK